MNKVIVDKARLLRRAIVISWATLALCFIVKIFGGNFFEIMYENPNYKALCEYADSHFWLKYSLEVLSSFLCQYFFLLAISQKYKMGILKGSITFISICVASLIKHFGYNIIGVILDLWLTIGLPILFLGKNYKKYLAIPIGIVLILAFQSVSLFTKNLSVVPIGESTFISLIYMIDLYLMCLLYYLYRNYQKENEKMGAFWVFFAGKPVDRLLKMKARREAKIKKLETEINAIEIELSKRKNEK